MELRFDSGECLAESLEPFAHPPPTSGYVFVFHFVFALFAVEFWRASTRNSLTALLRWCMHVHVYITGVVMRLRLEPSQTHVAA